MHSVSSVDVFVRDYWCVVYECVDIVSKLLLDYVEFGHLLSESI